MTETEEKVRTILAEIVMPERAKDFDPNTSLYDMLDDDGNKGAFDSLDQVEFVMMLEENFDVEIPDHDAEKIKSIAQAVETVNFLCRRRDQDALGARVDGQLAARQKRGNQ